MENSNALKETIVQVTCTAKKQKQGYTNNSLQHEIELSVPYDQNSIFYQMSGGTVMTLNTVNQAAADMFVIGGVYEMSIKPKEIKAAETASE
jgi:hypothetical protein